MFMRMYVVFLDFVHPALLQFFHFITFGAGNQMDSLQDMMDVLRNGVALFCHVLVIQIPDMIKIFTQAVFHHTVVDHCNPVDGAVVIQPKIRCSARKKHIGVRHILEIVHNAAADQAEFKFFTLLAKLQHIADAPAALIRGKVDLVTEKVQLARNRYGGKCSSTPRYLLCALSGSR